MSLPCRCCGCLCPCNRAKHTELVEDNCCQCNLAALKKLAGLKDSELDLIYVTYHVDVSDCYYINSFGDVIGTKECLRIVVAMVLKKYLKNRNILIISSALLVRCSRFVGL